jgi:hypothetical protein
MARRKEIVFNRGNIDIIIDRYLRVPDRKPIKDLVGFLGAVGSQTRLGGVSVNSVCSGDSRKYDKIDLQVIGEVDDMKDLRRVLAQPYVHFVSNGGGGDVVFVTSFKRIEEQVFNYPSQKTVAVMNSVTPVYVGGTTPIQIYIATCRLHE